jgi:hypothetical protein
MRKSKFTESQILAALKQAESGLPVNDVCRQIGVRPRDGSGHRNKVPSLDQKRQWVRPLVEADGASVSMACDVVGRTRSTGYSVPQRKQNPEDLVIEEFLRQCVEKRPQREFWKCYQLARRKGFVGNHQRGYRVYRQIGLHLRRRVRYRPPAAVKQPMPTPVAPGGVWTMDFMRTS